MSQIVKLGIDENKNAVFGKQQMQLENVLGVSIYPSLEHVVRSEADLDCFENGPFDESRMDGKSIDIEVLEVSGLFETAWAVEAKFQQREDAERQLRKRKRNRSLNMESLRYWDYRIVEGTSAEVVLESRRQIPFVVFHSGSCIGGELHHLLKYVADKESCHVDDLLEVVTPYYDVPYVGSESRMVFSAENWEDCGTDEIYFTEEDYEQTHGTLDQAKQHI